MLDSLGNIMVTIAIGLAIFILGIFFLAMIDSWLEGRAGKPFLTIGVVGTMAIASLFWWVGWWWQAEAARSGQNEAYGYGLVAVALFIGSLIVLRNFIGAKWQGPLSGPHCSLPSHGI